MGRISIAGILAAVAVFAIGLAALVNATETWLGVAYLLMIGVLLASVLATVLRGWRRGGWLGFALFGWGLFLLGYQSGPGPDRRWILADGASDWVFSRSNPSPIPPATFATSAQGSSPMTPEDSAYYAANSLYNERSGNATMIGRSLSVLAFGGLGAILGVLLARGRRADEPAPPPA
jgi:hypothetical protein